MLSAMTDRPPLRLAIVNDYEIVVAGVAAMLAPFSDRIEVVELDARMPVATEVDLVLYDSFGQRQGAAMDLSPLVGEEAASEARLVIYSWNTRPELVAQALAHGAHSYLSKSLTSEQLVEALERVHGGEQVTPEPADEGAEMGGGQWPGEEHGLSPREAEVLALICQGLSNQEITERAFIGMNTVKTYIRTLYAKIGVASRSQAVLWGLDHGFRPDRVRHSCER